jgi:hypothetical protein
MTQKSDHLAELRNQFSRRWAPLVDDYHDKGDFEIALDRLIYAAIAAGQEPFARELQLFHENMTNAINAEPFPIKPR